MDLDHMSLQMKDKERCASFPVIAVRYSGLMGTSIACEPAPEPTLIFWKYRVDAMSTGLCECCSDMGIC